METTASNLTRPLPVHRLQGKVAIITGGGGKIGVEAAARLLREGANISLVDISAEALETAVAWLSDALSTGQILQSRILPIHADVTSEADVEAYTRRTLQTFGRLDCVFLSAEIRYTATSIFDTKEEDYERVMRANVKSAFLGLKHAAIAMRDLGNGGSIILKSSTAGLSGSPGQILYSGSKFALRGLALTAAAELGEFGIRVNTIHPSEVNTPISRDAQSPEKLEELEEIPLGRFAQVDDIAGVIAFLASADSKFMTGGLLKVDGGSVSF